MTRDPNSRNQLPEARSLKEYLTHYTTLVAEAIANISENELDAVYSLLVETHKSGRKVFAAGNGGSSAIADHLCCDWMKGTFIEGKAALKVHSLTGNTALFTAIANDFGYEKSFSCQIEMLAQPGDVLVLISSSGNSPNIVEAAMSAKKKGMKVVGFCGFSGGKLKEVSDHCLFIPIKNYGMVEDAHQVFMHVFAQYFHLKQLSKDEP